MRARDSGLALALGCLLCGCLGPPHRGAESGNGALDPGAASFAQALAHYSQALIDESTQGGWDRSLTHWRGAVESDPTNVVLRLKLGAALLQRKELSEAVRILEKARDIAPILPEVRLLLGSAYQLSDRGREARREFQALIRVAPEHPDGYIRLAALHLGRGDSGGAMRVLDQGLDHPGASVAILQFCENMGRLHLANGNVKDAIECFERIRSRLPDSLPLLELLARCHAAAGDRKKAIDEFEALLRLNPRNGPVAFALAELYEEAGDLGRAEILFEQATLNQPTEAAPFLRLAFLQLPRSREQAMATLNRALRSVPDDPLIHAYFGLVYSRDGRFDLAVEAFAKTEALVARNGAQQLQPAFYFWYGTACERAGQFERAEALLETCIQKNPRADDALNYLAYTWAERGVKLDKALEYVTRALAISPDDGAYVDTLGWVYYKKGRYEEALKALQRALRLVPGDATIAGHVGDALHALGRTREAGRYWVMALRADPGNAGLRAKVKAAGLEPDAVLKLKP